MSLNHENLPCTVEIVIPILSYYEQCMAEIQEGLSLFQQSQHYRIQSLLRYKQSGVWLAKIREVLSVGTKTNPVVTDMGTYPSFENFLSSSEREGKFANLSRSQLRRYITLADNWDVIEDLRMLEESAGYRLDITIKIIAWGKRKRGAGYNLKELDHQLYFKEREELAAQQERTGKPTYAQLEKKVDELTYKLEELSDKLQESNQEVSRLRRQLSLEESFALLPAEPGRL